MTWTLACWLWVALPLLGIVPMVPVRMAVVWLMMLGSVAVIGVGLSRPRTSQGPFGWMLLSCLSLACLCWRQPTDALTWVSQATLLLGAAAMLQGSSRPLRQAVIACAWVQIPVLILQWYQVPLPWAHLPVPWQMAGTVGSIRPASILLGIACLWSTGWRAWVLGLAAGLTGSGTVVPVVLLKLWWPVRRHLVGWLAAAGVLVVGARFAPAWMLALSERAEVWRTWPLTVWGVGFKAFPVGFQDDTPVGRAMEWRDAHNVLLDWVGRFGLPGLLVLLAVGWWVLRRKPDPWTLGFFAWVACWQSLEQFPVLVILFLVWLIGLSEGGRECGSASSVGTT